VSLHSCPPRPVFQSDVVTLRDGAARSNAAALLVECERCEDGTRFAGNSPAGGVRCEACDGTGQVEVVCELCGEYGATDLLEGRPYHLGCAEEVLSDMHRVLERAA